MRYHDDTENTLRFNLYLLINKIKNNIKYINLNKAEFN